jgi:FtsP/CotA-like multicopper oxidase with cupredoxin domain
MNRPPKLASFAHLVAWSLLISALPGQTTHRISLVAKPGTAQIEPGKIVRNAWLFNGQLPGPAIRVTEGDRVRVTLKNELPEPTTLHWHGLPIPLAVDGVPGVSQGLVGVGQEYTYEFVANRPGTYWYHPHVDLQIDRGLVAPLIVYPKNKAADPKYDREHLIVLDDWLPGSPVAGRDPIYSDYLINGKTSRGQQPLVVKKGEVVRLRFINASGMTNYVVTVDGHPMRVTHTDGQPVVPVITKAIPIGVGERYDVYITANNPGKWSIAAAPLQARNRTLVRAVLAYASSTAAVPSPSYVPAWLRSAPLLSYSQLASSKPLGPISTTPNRVHDLLLGWGGMRRYVWTINGQAFPNADPLDVKLGEIVRFNVTNRTMVAHPMHIHGHFFRVIGSGGGTKAPLVKDTLLVPRGGMMNPGRLDAEFLADNPGNWAYHCHMIYHMGAGMMRLVRYVGTDADADGLADGVDFDPAHGQPVSWTDSRPGNYVPGATVRAILQWPTGETAIWYAGLPLTNPVPLGALGMAGINPLAFLGTARTAADQRATLSIAIPRNPSLSGLRLGLQAIVTHRTLRPGHRLSTRTMLTIR